MYNLFNAKVDVLRFTKVRDAMGGYKEAEGIIHQNVPCRINWSSGSERIQFNKNTYYRDAVLYCKVIDINIKDRIRYVDTIYEIVEVSNVDNVNKFLTISIRLIQ